MTQQLSTRLLALQNAPLQDPTEEISEGARKMVESFLEAIPRLGVALLLTVIGYVLSRTLRWGLRNIFERNQTESFARVISKLAGWIAFSAFALAATAAAFPSVKPVDLLAGLGFFSVAVGFAFQDILENTLSGVLLLIRQPFESGDQIEVHDQTGTVEAITIRETRIKTYDGQLVVIPNRDVYKNVIRVQTHFPTRRLSFVAGVAFENDARDACKVIVDALRGVDGIDDDPEPEALVIELGVSTVNIEARFWCAPAQHNVRLVQDEAIKAVKEALEAAQIEMPADIIALQATSSFRAAMHNDAEVTPGGSVKA